MASQNFTQLRADGAYELRLEMSSVPNTSGNYSDVTYNLYVRSISSTAAYNYGYGNRVYLAINDSVILDTANIGRVTFTGPNQTHQFAYGTVKVNHNADGSKGIDVKAIFQQTQALSAANYDISGTFSLDTIPRTSIPTLNTSSATLGETSVTVNTNRASTSFTHTLTMKIGNVTVKTVNSVGASYTWTPEESLAKYFTTNPSATIVTTCTTYNGSTAIGSKNVYLIVYVPDTMIPTCSLTVAEAASLPSGITGFIKGKSRLKVTVSASGVQDSTISGYSIKANGATYNATPATTEVLTTAGTNTITAFVRDSRGMASETITEEITVIDYSAPAISKLSAYRCKAADDMTEDAQGEFIAVTLSGKVTSLSGQNAKSCIVYYQKNGDSDRTALPEMMADSYELTDATVIFPADTDSSYNIEIEITDSFTLEVQPYKASVGSGFTLINIPASGKGLGIGKVAETDELLDSAWDMAVQSEEAVQKNVRVGNINGKVGIRVAPNGNKGLVDVDDEQWIIYKNKEGGNAAVQYDLYGSGIFLPLGGMSIRPTTADRAATGKGGIYTFKASSSMKTNKPPWDGHILGFEWDGTNGFDSQIAVKNSTGDMAVRGMSSGTWSDWKHILSQNNMGDYVYNTNGSETNGYARFPHSKLQICWKKVNASRSFVASGNIYESNSAINLGSWAATFKSVPAVTYGVIAAADCWFSQHTAATASSAGQGYLKREGALTESRSYTVCAIGIGYYS